MSSSDDIILQSMEDLQDKVQSIATMQGFNNILLCLSTVDLEEMLTPGTSLPAVGIMYVGQSSYYKTLHGIPKSSHNVGLATMARFSLVLLTESKTLFGVDTKPTALNALNAMRQVVKDTTGPSGHFWKFVAEVPAAERDGTLIWMQNWEVPVLI